MFELIQIPVLTDNYIYLFHDSQTGSTAVIDPAVADPVLDVLAVQDWTLTHILCTHHHSDHVGGVSELKAATGATVVGASHDRARIPELDMAVEDGDTVMVGLLRGQVLDTPGHTLGHICYWFHGESVLFCGDTMFSMGCGRLFEGTAQQMWESLSRLSALPAETLVYCAHEYTQSNGRFALTVEPDNADLIERMEQVGHLRSLGRSTVPTTLALERATNPFLRAGNAQRFAEIRRQKDVF